MTDVYADGSKWTEQCSVKRCRGFVVLRHCGNEYCARHWEEYCEQERVREDQVDRLWRTVHKDRTPVDVVPPGDVPGGFLFS